MRGDSPHIGSGPRIGIVEVKGPIGMGDGGVDSERVLSTCAASSGTRASRPSSSGSTRPAAPSAPSQEIFDEVKKVAAKKTVVCSMGSVAASGGFYVAMGCPKGNVMAEPGTITGSIGVISQFPNLSRIAQRFDFKMETVKSGALKDAGNPFRDMTAGGPRLLAGADRPDLRASSSARWSSPAGSRRRRSSASPTGA